jgi:hypothetical protein
MVSLPLNEANKEYGIKKVLVCFNPVFLEKLTDSDGITMALNTVYVNVFHPTNQNIVK